MDKPKAQRLGEYLLKAAAVTRSQLDLALREARRTGELLGDAMVRLGFVSREALATALAEQAGIPQVDLETLSIDRELVRLVPEPFARRHRLMPIAEDNYTLTVAIANVFGVEAIDELQRMTNRFVKVVSARESQILAMLDRYYTSTVRPEQRTGEAPVAAQVKASEQEAEGSAIRIINDLFQRAAREGATDIHIEPEEEVLRTRFRRDGILRPGPTFSKALHRPIVTRIKVLANLSISESRLPQDGRILYEEGVARLDLRVSTFPTIHGENVVIRVLDRTRTFSLEQLGFAPEKLALYKSFLDRPYGLILVTGPTGSGKTTTLYSTLAQINAIEKHVITLEDPVEYEIPYVRQSQINPKAGFTFAAGLRSVLRHDPDVIRVGAMRVLETVETTIRAALTGHLVFSTFHTNDAVGAISRLVEMGVEPFLVASSLLVVVAQRLVRVLCRRCRTEVPPGAETLARLGPKLQEAIPVFYAGKGCPSCDHTGYRGRIAIFELLPVTPEIARITVRGADPVLLRQAALREGMETMFQDGIRKVAAGITTVDEVIRVTAQTEE